MKKQELIFNEKGLANSLREELFKVSKADKETNLSDLEMISTSDKVSMPDKTYVSPIFSMNEDEILAFVEEFDVKELATLSVAELNHIGEVLGVDPKILAEGMD